MAQESSKPKESYSLNPMDEIFKGDPLEKAIELQQKETKEVQVNDSEKKKKIKMQLGKKIKRTNSKKKKRN